MANETEFSNYTTVAAFVAAATAPHFRDAAIMPNAITVEEPMLGSNAKKFSQKGSLTAAVTAESIAATKSEYTETDVTLTLQKGVVYVELSHEAQAYQSGDQLAALAQEAGDALGELFDTDACALFSSFTTSVGTTTVDLTPSVFKEAAYNLRLNKVLGTPMCILHPTNVNQIGDDILASQATVYGSQANQDLITSVPRAFEGTFLGIPIWSTTVTESINAAADWSGGMLSPYAIAALMRPSMTVNIGKNIQSSLHELAVIMDYQVGAWNLDAGIQIVAAQ